MTVVVTLKEPFIDWQDKNVKRFSNVLEVFTAHLVNQFSMVYHDQVISLDAGKIANIVITY